MSENWKFSKLEIAQNIGVFQRSNVLEKDLWQGRKRKKCKHKQLEGKKAKHVEELRF
jgi:hypothetical protein